MNIALVQGRLSSAPRVHELASGDVVVRYEVTVPRPGGAAESVPVAWIGPPARAAELAAGEEVVVVGRVRRRWYRPPGGPSRSVCELLAEAVVPARRRAAARRVAAEGLARARAALGVDRSRAAAS